MARGFALYDVRDLQETASVGSDGTALVNFGSPDQGHHWKVTLIAVWSNSAVNGPARIFLDDPSVTANFRGGTGSGTGDMDTAATLWVPSSRELVVQWAGLTPGATCTAVIQFEDLIGVALPSDYRLFPGGG